MTEKFVGIQGRKDIVKPLQNQWATINVNEEAYKAARSRSKDKQRISSLENKVEELGTKLDLIWDFLQNGNQRTS